MEKTLKAKKEESALERFMEQKPIVYGVVIMTALAVLCGAVLGLAGLFLRAPEQAGINDRERAILEIIMPSEEYELFEEDGADYASDKKTFKIERVYIATGAQNKGNAAVMAGGTGYNGGAIKSITAFDKADDTVLGFRVYSTLLEAKQTSGVADAAFKPEQGDALTGIGALALSQAASADGLRDAYTGVTAKFTVNGIIQGAANAAAFYLKHKGAFPDGGSASDPAAEAIRRVYPSAPANVNYGAYIRAGAPDGITVYLVNRVPFVEVRLEGFENAVMIYFTNIADDYRSAETFMTMVGAAWHDQNAFDAALEKGKKFWAAHHADYVGVADSDPEKAQYDKIMNRFDGGAAYAYEPVLASTLDRALNGNWDAVMRDGEGYVYRIVKAFAEGKNDCYIVAASAESFAGQLVSYTLIEDAGESAGAARYFIRQVLTFPDRSKEQYIAGYLDADNFYLYLAKFAAPITAANYQTGDFMPNGKGTEGAEQSVADGFGEAGAYAVRSYEGITQGVVKAVRNLRETLQIQ